MGEYARYNGERVKIGTCEELFYLRADQAADVEPLPGNVDPMSAEAREYCLFRFPYPDEDGIEPGAFESGWREYRIHGVKPPDGVDHGIVQFTNRNGYLLNMPCPESSTWQDPEGGKLHLNGYRGAVDLIGQRYWNGMLVGVCRCKGCGHIYRMPTLADAAPVLEALEQAAAREIATADRNGTKGNRAIARRIIEVGNRLAAGYKVGALA